MLAMLADAFVKATVLLVLAAVVTVFLRRSPASLRHLVWTLACGGVLALPLASALLPNWKLALWPRKEIAHDANITLAAPSATEFTIGHNVNSREEVDAVMEQAKRAGAKITKPAENTFWGGYAGYFQDPDGHLWEVVWNPQLPTDD